MSKDKIIELSEQGKSVTDIAKELNVSKAHVSQTLKRHRDKQPTPEPKSQEPSPAPSPESPSSSPEPAAKIEPQDQGPAAEPKNRELELQTQIGELQTENLKFQAQITQLMQEALDSKKQATIRAEAQRIESHTISEPKSPEFDDLIQFCRDNTNDIECKQFIKHTDPQLMMKRGGGGWAGPVKCTLAVIRKYNKVQ